MAGFGMIGAVGGLGQGLEDEGKDQYKIAGEQRAIANQKDLQGWLMAQQDQYAVAREGRAEQGEIRKDERTWKNEKDRAPEKREMKVADETASAKGKSATALETLPADATVSATLADSKETALDKKVKSGTARQHEAVADYYQGAKTTEAEARAAAAGGKVGKMDPMVAEQARQMREEINEKTKLIDAQRAQGGGSWDPEKNPSQKQMVTELAGLRLRHDALMSGGAGRADPLGIRGGTTEKPAGMIGEKPYTMKSGRGAEPAPNVDAQGGFNTADPGLRAGIDNIADPQERANARLALTNQTAPMVPAGAKPPAAPAPATPTGIASPVAAATGGLGPKPERNPGEGLQQFKARLIAWDEARMAGDTASGNAASEARRQAALAGRPDLQQVSERLRQRMALQ